MPLFVNAVSHYFQPPSPLHKSELRSALSKNRRSLFCCAWCHRSVSGTPELTSKWRVWHASVAYAKFWVTWWARFGSNVLGIEAARWTGGIRKKAASEASVICGSDKQRSKN